MSEKNFSIKVEEAEPVVSLRVTGYCNETVGREMVTALKAPLKEGKVNVVVDFSKCDLINSQGVSALFDLTISVREDHLGRVIFSGLSPLMIEVFSLSGLLPLVEVVNDVGAALASTREKT